MSADRSGSPIPGCPPAAPPRPPLNIPKICSKGVPRKGFGSSSGSFVMSPNYSGRPAARVGQMSGADHGVSLGTGKRPTPVPGVRLVDIRSAPIDAAEVLGAVEDEAAGGVTLFVGTVRDHDGDRSVSHLE